MVLLGFCNLAYTRRISAESQYVFRAELTQQEKYFTWGTYHFQSSMKHSIFSKVCRNMHSRRIYLWKRLPFQVLSPVIMRMLTNGVPVQASQHRAITCLNTGGRNSWFIQAVCWGRYEVKECAQRVGLLHFNLNGVLLWWIILS